MKDQSLKLFQSFIFQPPIQMKRMKRTNEEIDADLYSTSILEELLESSEWRDVDDIIKLTFKAVNDIVQTHAQSIKDVKALLTTRASKTELNTGLSLKTNVSDVSKAVEQLSKALEERPSYQEITSMLRDFASKADLIELLAQQSEDKGRRESEEQKESLELSILKARMDDFQKQISKRVGACVTLPEFQEVLSILQNKANINEINEALESKVSKQYLSTALQKKVSKNDLDASLSKKADTADLDYLINSLEGKVNVGTLEKLTQVLQNKADKSDLVILGNERNHNRSQQRAYEEEWNERFEQLKGTLLLDIKEAKRQLSLEVRESETSLSAFVKNWDSELKKSMLSLQTEMMKKLPLLKLQLSQEMDALRQLSKYIQEDLNNHKKFAQSIANDFNSRKRGEEHIYSEIDNLRKIVEENNSHAVSKTEYIDFKSEITETLAGKAEIQIMQTALEDLTNETNSKITEDKRETQKLVRDLIRKFQERIEETAAAALSETIQIKKTLNKKQDRNDISAFQDILKRIRKEVEDCRKTVDISYSQIHSKISVKEYETDLIEIRKRFQSLKKEVQNKANIKDVCVLADSKPNIDDINNALREINQALADKVTEADLQSIIKDQATINETLCSQNIVGRWMWQTGEVKAGGLIPWESESANTVPDHFFWEKDKTSILIIAAGVYEITACAFGKNCQVIILANGEQVNSKESQENSNTMNRRVRKRKEKEIGSTSICEYVLLPQRSRISITVNGDASEGFLNIRRL